jgi:hypothetical protein
MAQRTPSSVLAMALLIGGCPHPQTGPRIVYVPSAPPQAKPPTAASVDSQVIEEPPPPAEPEVEVAPEEPSASKPPRPRRRPVTGEPPVQTEPAPESPEPASAEVPPLAPRETPEQEASLRSQVARLQNTVQERVTRVDVAKLVATDRKTLEDARTFLEQSKRALEKGDLQRSLNLARKASLLVAALEKQP